MSDDAVDLDLAAFDAAGDTLYVTPYVDIDEWRDEPVRHRYLHGGFVDTDHRFSLYLPPAEHYRGRFFQPVLPMAGTETAQGAGMLDGMGASLAFIAHAGGYLVESNMGSMLPQPATGDPTTLYRASAAAARVGWLAALATYGPGPRPYGYVWGGSGGAFKSIACIESVRGVWDGAAPFVPGSPMAIPNVFAVQSHAMRLLWDRIPEIVDALEPGGSGDVFAGLTASEREALAEVTRFGFPPGAWFDVDRINASYTMLWGAFADTIRGLDPTYFDDFWAVPGYLGHDAPAGLLGDLIELDTVVTGVVMPDDPAAAAVPSSLASRVSAEVAARPVGVRLAAVADRRWRGVVFTITSGEAAGRRLYVSDVIGDLVVMHFGGHPKGLAGVAAGDTVATSNRDYLAFQTYHRHQYAPGYAGWDQYLVNGVPIYPQRGVLIGPMPARFGAGSLQSGRFEGKMIVVASLLDEAAYPWQADWYRQQVAGVHGDSTDDHFRLWYVDQAMHSTPSPTAMDSAVVPSLLSRTVSYRGVLEQALGDLVAWVERGDAPPATTGYAIDGGQVVLAAAASDRRGVQPVVRLTVAGSSRIEVAVGAEIEFNLTAEVPGDAGTITEVAWDLTGDGHFVADLLNLASGAIDGSATALVAMARFRFDHPGTWFPAVRVTAQRARDHGTHHGRADHLGRVRAIVA